MARATASLVASVLAGLAEADRPAARDLLLGQVVPLALTEAATDDGLDDSGAALVLAALWERLEARLGPLHPVDRPAALRDLAAEMATMGDHGAGRR